MTDGIKLIFGGALILQSPKETQEEFLSVLQEYNVKDIDTAYSYPGSEEAFKILGASKKFTIHTKAKMGSGGLKKETVLAAAQESLERLGVDSVDTYFFHCPDAENPIEEGLEAIQELYKAGKFRHFGLSNFTEPQVQEIHSICTSKNYVLPTVYQGNYNPVARHAEDDLFPLLRRLKMAFYVYSPLAGGFLVHTPETIAQGSEGRFDKGTRMGQIYHKLYARPTLIKALTEWEAIAKEAGISKSALAYRWVAYNSALKGEDGDGVIIGASRPSQLRETLEALKAGPLESKYAQRIEGVWEAVKHEAPFHNTDVVKL